MKKVLTIGGATQDIYLHYEGADFMSITKKDNAANYMLFESGAKVEVEDILYYTGGGSTNSAVSFKRMELNTTCFCKIGDDIAGETVLEELRNEKIDTSSIAATKIHPTGISIIINSLRRERTIFAHRGVNGHLESKELPIKQIKDSDQIYITSLSYNSAKLLPEIAKLAKKNNVSVAINPGISQLAKGTLILKESLQYIDTFILNSDEAKAFMLALVSTDESYKKAFESSKKATDKTTQAPELLSNPFVYENLFFSIRKFFKEVLKMGPKIVVVTDGANGVYIATDNEILFHPSIKTEVIDTLGAGDAFGSCFIASLLHGYKIEEALRNGIINSSSVISQMGAKPGLLTHEQLKEKIKELKDIKVQKFTMES
jgi:sugar/nucleoside kinase (ribokinase family)